MCSTNCDFLFFFSIQNSSILLDKSDEIITRNIPLSFSHLYDSEVAAQPFTHQRLLHARCTDGRDADLFMRSRTVGTDGAQSRILRSTRPFRVHCSPIHEPCDDPILAPPPPDWPASGQWHDVLCIRCPWRTACETQSDSGDGHDCPMRYIRILVGSGNVISSSNEVALKRK